MVIRAPVVVVAVISVVHTACSRQSPCQPSYVQSFPLPAAVNSLDCTFTITGLYRVSGQVVLQQYDVPSPAPGQTSSCAPVAGAAPLSCTRDAPTDGSPQTISVDVETPQLGAFEQAAGGTMFTVSVTCGTVGVLTDDPQGVETCVAWSPSSDHD